MSHVWRAAVALLAVALLTPAVAQDKPEVPKPRLAVGGKSAIFYLPLSITERLGYFRGAGLDVEIADVQSGARALQSLVGGSAEVGVGTFDHTIQMQAKGQAIVAVAQFGRYPGFVLATQETLDLMRLRYGEALPCAFPASTAYAGTNAPQRRIGWKRSSECWRRSRADAPRPLP